MSPFITRPVSFNNVSPGAIWGGKGEPAGNPKSEHRTRFAKLFFTGRETTGTYFNGQAAPRYPPPFTPPLAASPSALYRARPAASAYSPDRPTPARATMTPCTRKQPSTCRLSRPSPRRAR
eukprot:scaffold97629_cov46-Phaeocystis_antarctica.AAC.2